MKVDSGRVVEVVEHSQVADTVLADLSQLSLPKAVVDMVLVEIGFDVELARFFAYYDVPGDPNYLIPCFDWIVQVV